MTVGKEVGAVEVGTEVGRLGIAVGIVVGLLGIAVGILLGSELGLAVGIKLGSEDGSGQGYAHSRPSPPILVSSKLYV